MFRTVPLSIIRSFLLYTQQWYMSYRFAVCTVKNSWWWTEELSETCRVSFQKYIWEITPSSWLHYKNLSRCTVTWTSNDLAILVPFVKDEIRRLDTICVKHLLRHNASVSRLMSEMTPEDSKWPRDLIGLRAIVNVEPTLTSLRGVAGWLHPSVLTQPSNLLIILRIDKCNLNKRNIFFKFSDPWTPYCDKALLCG